VTRRLIVVLSIVYVSACGSSTTTSPSTIPGGGLPFHAGRYVMNLTGFSDPCGDIKVPQAGTTVSFVLTMSADATGWTGKTSSGGLTMRFEPSTANSFPPFAIPLRGTASGFADDEAPVQPPGFTVQPNGTRASFASAITFSGGIPTASFPGFSMGTVNGPVVFSRNGVTSTCPSGAVEWTMNGLQ
jgi:hypothetical protein